MKGVLGVFSRSQGKKTPLWWCRLRISAFREPTRLHQTYEHTKSHARRNWQKNQTGTEFWTSAEEDRFLTFGHSSDGHLLVVSHTDRREQIRVMSARRATRKERRIYEE